MEEKIKMMIEEIKKGMDNINVNEFKANPMGYAIKNKTQMAMLETLVNMTAPLIEIDEYMKKMNKGYPHSTVYPVHNMTAPMYAEPPKTDKI